jgi:phosphoribosylanthranilate isomerase
LLVGQLAISALVCRAKLFAMTTKVKICGLKTEAALAAALDARADLVGFVFYPMSPRHLSVDAARPLAKYARGIAASVALIVDPDDSLLDKIVSIVEPDMIQLHGSETPERVAQISKRWGKPVMKAIRVETAEDTVAALAFRGAAELILFDAKPASGLLNSLPGGNGAAFDWHVLSQVGQQVPFMLSGGLNPDNVGEAIRQTGAKAVDVSSGVERSPGEKDANLIRRFVLAAKAARGAV